MTTYRSQIRALSLVAAAALAAPLVATTPGVPIDENFDGVTPPALPYAWVAQGLDLWKTDDGNPDTLPNSAYVDGVAYPADDTLDSPPFIVMTSGAYLSFRHRYAFFVDPGSRPESFDVGFGALEISIGGSAFQDILTAGGGFVSGGYTDSLGWVESIALYSSVLVKLPNAAAGTTVVIRWHLHSLPSANGGGGGQWWVDSVRVCDGYPCYPDTTPQRLDVDTGGNGVLEAGETVDLDPYYLNGTHGSIALSGVFDSYAGPPGTAITVLDSTASFGTIPPLGVAGCVDASDCYSVSLDDPGTRPAQHWDAQFWEALSNGQTTVWALHVGGSFADAPASNLFYEDVETVFHRGVTGGCGGGGYCPTSPALRKQMAVFLLKSLYGAAYVPPAATGVFADVPPSDPFAPWIENLYALGITGGCGTAPLRYCPDQAVLRQQMAVFLLKTANGSAYMPPSCAGVFADVPCPSPFADWIEDLHARQIAAGCGGDDFCPGSPNTRGQMAVFLRKTFGLTLYGP